MLKFQKNVGNEMDFKENLNTLLIALLINSNLKCPMAHLMMIDDYIFMCKEYEKEKEVILKYKVNFIIFFLHNFFKIALQYIVEELNI